MNVFWGILSVFLSAVLSFVASSYFSAFGAIPDFLFIALVLISITEDFPQFLFYNFLAALFAGFLSNLPLGVIAPSIFISLALTNILFRYYFQDFDFFTTLFYSIAAFSVFKISEIGFLYAFSHPLAANFHFGPAIAILLRQMIYNVFIIILIFSAFRKLNLAWR